MIRDDIGFGRVRAADQYRLFLAERCPCYSGVTHGSFFFLGLLLLLEELDFLIVFLLGMI